MALPFERAGAVTAASVCSHLAPASRREDRAATWLKGYQRTASVGLGCAGESVGMSVDAERGRMRPYSQISAIGLMGANGLL